MYTHYMKKPKYTLIYINILGPPPMSSEKIVNFNLFNNFRTSEFSQTTPPPPPPPFGNVRNLKPPPHLPDVLCQRPLTYNYNM